MSNGYGAQPGVPRYPSIAREANILAYNDVFLLVGVLAVFVALWGYAIRWSIRRRGEQSPIILLQQAMQKAQAQQGQ